MISLPYGWSCIAGERSEQNLWEGSQSSVFNPTSPTFGVRYSYLKTSFLFHSIKYRTLNDELRIVKILQSEDLI